MPLLSAFANIAARAEKNSQGFINVNVNTPTTSTSQSIAQVAGDVIVVILAFDPGTTATNTVSVSDGTNTYTQIGTVITGPATGYAATTGVSIAAFYTKVISDGTRTVTPAYTSTPSKMTMVVLELTNAAKALVSRSATLVTSAVGTNTGPANIVSPVANTGDVVIGFTGWEQNLSNFTSDTDTLNGSWATAAGTATTGGAAATNIAIGYQYKIVTGQGAQTWSIANQGSSNWASLLFVVKAA